MKKYIIASSLAFLTGTILLCSTSMAQGPAIQWQKCIGGSLHDRVSNIQQTSDGGYIVAGFSQSNDGDVPGHHADYDIWVVKISATAEIEWQKSLGGTSEENSTSIQQTFDGGYILSGYTRSNNGDITSNKGYEDYRIVKLTNNGDMEWQKTMGGPGDDRPGAIIQTADSGYIIAGGAGKDGDVIGNHGYEDYWVVRMSPSGGIKWQKSIGGSGVDMANSIKQTSDGGFIIGGLSESTDGDATGVHNGHTWIVKLDDTGAIQWNKSYLGDVYSVAQTDDGGYIAGGYTYSFVGSIEKFEAWALKIDNIGNTSWKVTFKDHVASSISQTADKGFLIAGHKAIFGQGSDAWLIKLNNSGATQWEKHMGGSINDVALSAQQTSDRGYVMAGYAESNNEDVSGNHGLSDYWVVKFNEESKVTQFNSTASQFTILPNPTTGEIKLTGAGSIYNINVFNVAGILVKSAVKTDAISISEFSAGLYLLSVTDENGIQIFADKLIKR